MHDGADVIGHAHVVQFAPGLHDEVEFLAGPHEFGVDADKRVTVGTRVFVPETESVSEFVQQCAKL